VEAHDTLSSEDPFNGPMSMLGMILSGSTIPTDRGDTMDDSQRLQACMKQAEFYTHLFDARRNYEWKVTLGFWTLLILAIGTRPLSGNLPIWLGLPTIVLLGGTHIFVWLRGVYVAHETDKRRAFHFAAHAEMILLDPSHVPGSSPGQITFGGQTSKWLFGFLRSWGSLFQAFTSFVLVCLAAYSCINWP
jgi:hypothetical protein